MRSKAITVLFLALALALLAACTAPSYLWRITTCGGTVTQVRATGCEMAYSSRTGNTVTCWTGWNEAASVPNACALERLEGQP